MRQGKPRLFRKLGVIRVLVTRPEPDAMRTARALTEAGYDPVVLPLSETVPIERAALPAITADAVAVTSANALHFAPLALLEPLLSMPLFAVGPRTADAARQAGFSDVREGPGDALRLGDVLPAQVRTVLYLCGRVRRPEFERDLGARGVAVSAVETYDTRECMPSPDEARLILGDRPVDVALLYSAFSAEAFLRLKESVPDFLGDARCFALSPRIAQSAGLHAFAPAQPNEEALLALLAARASPRG